MSSQKKENRIVQRLTRENFKEEIQDIISNFYCPICKGILFNPITDYCGHAFCAKCFEIYTSDVQECPLSKKPLIVCQPIRVGVIADFLDKQIIVCKNKVHGCNWEGRVDEYLKHLLNECQTELINCNNQGCTLKIFRRDLPNHSKECLYRIESCPFCHSTMPFNVLESHEINCLKRPQKCPQGCGETIIKQNIEEHILKLCDFARINCPFHTVGCKTMPIKKDLEKHLEESINDHMLLFYNDFSNLSKILDQFIEKKLIEKTIEPLKRKVDLEYVKDLEEIKEKFYLSDDFLENNEVPFYQDFSVNYDIQFLGMKKSRLVEDNN